MKSILQWLVCLLVTASLAAQSQRQAETPNQPILILYAFAQEGQELAGQMIVEKCDTLLGRAVRSGMLGGKPVMIVESGVGMTNAAMMTQMLIDRFRPEGLVFTGIAGAVDSSVHIGDIVICTKWATHDYVNIGPDKTVPRSVNSYLASADSIARLRFIDADSAYLSVASVVSDQALSFEGINSRFPKVLMGVVGVSGNAFVDNAEKRDWLRTEFGACITDMESAAVAQVCLANRIPFIVFRSASDLAGGTRGQSARDELNRFFEIAAKNSAIFVVNFIAKL